MKPKQTPNAVVMVRPHHFVSNPQTMQDNAYQVIADSQHVSQHAYQEVTNVAQTLSDAGVTVHLFEDKTKLTPDSVFPNNWFSTHADGQLVIYPMYAPNRRMERRLDVIELFHKRYQVESVTDLSRLAESELFLEGTGSMVMDHLHKVVYAVESKRTCAKLVAQVCKQIGYEPVVFNAYDAQGVAVYHTNVLMCVASEFVMICLDMVPKEQRAALEQRFAQQNKVVIALTPEQIAQFCGNALELQGRDGRLLALSQTAYAALTHEQKAMIERSAKLLPMAIPTLESAGGSIRCMLGGVHLQKR
ncbi:MULTISPECIES: citrulline utilization hydrolase CtlX [Pseudoalteromonas]|uniref:Amidinotransferase n=1 Tax=Pseudoalteromonas amylolytica TaxID=1859457 RepID=A0A1S1MZB4_9GAMM|nr:MULTISPECIES: arginine deiminase-related protein [Pseudoalteromonas]OHU90199.1 amidinotransferase [Pseudoalteromonas sp. JW3]OHU92434.1 amidinotransferase [Pseudoalteromonas amylolytica]